MSNKKTFDKSILAMSEGERALTESVKLYDDVFFKQEIKELTSSFDLTKKARFEVAFKMWDSFQKWQNRGAGGMGYKYFLKGYIRAGKLQSKEKNLRAAFYVAKAFPDLEDESKRTKSYECYRMIATAHLSEETKRSLRIAIEQNDDIKSPQIVRMIKEAQKNEGKGIGGDWAPIAKRNFSKVGSNGNAILSELIKRGILEEVFSEARLKSKLDQNKVRWLQEIAGIDFNRISDILLKSKTIAKLKFFKVSSNGNRILNELIKKGILEEVSSEVRLTSSLDQNEDRIWRIVRKVSSEAPSTSNLVQNEEGIEKIAKNDFDKIIGILQRSYCGEDEVVITFKNITQFKKKFIEVFNPSENVRFQIKKIRKNNLGGGLE
ncbi:MAG: hypothetical protein HQL12_09615 [Candidatus Omnitrophica bacterium]|nr:hypothetical protein [Candidatus Omnitrophota bacterium]